MAQRFSRKSHFLGIQKGLNLGIKTEKQLQNKNNKVLSLKTFYMYT